MAEQGEVIDQGAEFGPTGEPLPKPPPDAGPGVLERVLRAELRVVGDLADEDVIESRRSGAEKRAVFERFEVQA